ncbi:hypothetical protein PG996_012257 [Apiospora saccharicola]|uniref:Uncharacterized protein n=1 Tax=Apiospora saccharicola TaxID=335842 RepID=A0ABR1U443_9PEZI
MPTGQLTSPLLRVNHEARAVFLKSFPVAADVFKTEVGPHNVWSRFLLVERTPVGELHINRHLYYDMASLREKSRHTGVVYLCPETDIFVLGFGPITGSARNLPRYRKIFECQSSPLPRQMTNSIKQFLCLAPFKPCPYSHIEASWDIMNVDSYPSAQTYRYVEAYGKDRGRDTFTFDERLEWERLRWSATNTPREFKMDLAQTKVPVRMHWVVHNGQRCIDKTTTLD